MRYKDINELSTSMKIFSEKTLREVIKVTEETAIELRDNVRRDAPVNTGQYRDSINYEVQVNGTSKKRLFGLLPPKHGNTVSAIVYSDQTLGERGSKNPRWMDVPLWSLLEWGTGSRGQSTGEAENYGFSYTPEWVGMVARPHFKPNLYKIKPIYRRRLRKAVFRAWIKRG